MNTKRVNAAASMIQASMARGNREAYSLAFDLESAGMLQSPETAAEMAALRARVAELEAAPSRDAVLAEVAAWLGKKAREYRSTRNRQHALQAETLETMASKIRRGAVRPEQPSPQHQLEDPHASPLHHDYVLGRDDLRFSAAEIAQWQARHGVVPRQVTGRCPNGHTFEDCTCGGTA